MANHFVSSSHSSVYFSSPCLPAMLFPSIGWAKNSSERVDSWLKRVGFVWVSTGNVFYQFEDIRCQNFLLPQAGVWMCFYTVAPSQKVSTFFFFLYHFDISSCASHWRPCYSLWLLVTPMVVLSANIEKKSPFRKLCLASSLSYFLTFVLIPWGCSVWWLMVAVVWQQQPSLWLPASNGNTSTYEIKSQLSSHFIGT